MSTNKSIKRLSKYSLPLLVIALPFISGCAHINLSQVAYEMLRQEDCKMNRLEDFCTRTFAKEYLEYEQLRQEFLRSQTQRTWRAQHQQIKLEETSNTI